MELLRRWFRRSEPAGTSTGIRDVPVFLVHYHVRPHLTRTEALNLAISLPAYGAFLAKNPGCSREAIGEELTWEAALESDVLGGAQWLLDNRPDECDPGAIGDAVKQGSTDCATWVIIRLKLRYTKYVALSAIASERFDFLRWYLEYAGVTQREKRVLAEHAEATGKCSAEAHRLLGTEPVDLFDYMRDVVPAGIASTMKHLKFSGLGAVAMSNIDEVAIVTHGDYVEKTLPASVPGRGQLYEWDTPDASRLAYPIDTSSRHYEGAISNTSVRVPGWQFPHDGLDRYARLALVSYCQSGTYGPSPEWDPTTFDDMEPADRLLFGARQFGTPGDCRDLEYDNTGPCTEARAIHRHRFI